MPESYRPSNGSEGDAFESAWCARCVVKGICKIPLHAMAHDVGDPDYPAAWVYSEAGEPTCTAFKDVSARRKPTRRADPRQAVFDFDAPAPVAAAPRTPEELVVALVEAGLVPNECIFDLNNGTLQNPDVPYSPRSLSFPVRLALDAPGGPRLELRTPATGSLPFVRRVEQALGIKAAWHEDSRDGMNARWHHAVDLATDDGWEVLLGSREHTTDVYIARAVQFGIERGALSLPNGRAVLAVLGAEEPADRSDALLFGPKGLRPCGSGAPNLHAPGAEGAWAIIHAFEGGWVKLDRQRHARVTPAYWRRVGQPDAPAAQAEPVRPKRTGKGRSAKAVQAEAA